MNFLSVLRRHLFRPSYAWLPCAVFAFFVLCFVLHPLSPITTHHLADPDDYMRLNETVAWMTGQNWHDVSVPRLSPGANTVIHWSRLVDVPIALVSLPFIHSLGMNNAALAASFIVPLIWFAVLLALLPALAAPIMGRSHANLTCVMALFAPMLLFDYTPGRVDHHGIQALIAGFGLCALNRILADDKGRLFAVLASLAFACGFWIGAEGLPWVILFIAFLGAAAAWQKGSVARSAALFGFSLPLWTAVLIPLALPATEFSSRALSWFSPAYVLFAGLAGGTLIFAWLSGYIIHHKFLRLAIYALVGVFAALMFFTLVPTALHGPFTDYDTFDATVALDSINEAQPLIKALHFNRFMPITWVHPGLNFARFLLLPFVALIFCLWKANTTATQPRVLWLAHGIFLLAALLLTVFWQLRVGIFMELFAIVPLTKLLCDWWKHLTWSLWDRPLFWAEGGVFLLLGALPVIFLPALASSTPLYPDLLLFPAARTAASCLLEPITSFLNDPSGLGSQPLTIMNTSDTGPQVLFATKHNAIAGNYDVAGNADAFTFFHTTDDAEAEASAKKWGADLVLVCRQPPNLYLGKDYYSSHHVALQRGENGLLHFINIDKQQPLIERLIRGEIPVWLKPIEIPVQSDYLLYRIQSSAGTK